MGSSLVKFRDMGIWVRDWIIEDWLHTLLQEIDAETDLPDWTQDLREDWSYQASGVGMGIIRVGLDQYATSADRVSWLIRLSEQTLLRFTTYSDSMYDLIQFGRNFIKLLRGELTIDPTDPRFIVQLKKQE
jgi:hypothetical protein